MDRLLELTGRAESEHFWFRGFRRFVAPVLRRAVAGRRGLTLLDCGCGTGYNLRTLSRYGAVSGMDLTAAGLTLAKASGRPLARADATRIPFRSHTFDIVTSFDMLQCVPDDGAAMREVARVLRPGGYFVGTVAALDMLRGDHSVLSEEVRRYTRSSMEMLLRTSDLEPVRIRYAFVTLFPLVFGVRTAQRLWRGHSAASGAEITVPPAPVNATLSALVCAEAAVARFIPAPIGSTLVVLARK